MSVGGETQPQAVAIDINGRTHCATVEPRLLLSDFIRDVAGLTGTNVGCEHGVCGACTVHLDGTAVRSCLMFAVQVGPRSIRTIEDLAGPDGELHPLQQAFQEAHALQCGFCTPGLLMSLEPYVRDSNVIDDEDIREALGGHVCRCTGYQGIVEAVATAQARIVRLAEETGSDEAQ